jgi:hypothetical protein
MKIYIAGKVSGENIAQCTIKFGQAQIEIEKLGHEAINPLQVVNNWHTPWQPAMRMCITALMTADAVYFLPDYRNSKGAMLELFISEMVDLPTIYNIKSIPQNEKH